MSISLVNDSGKSGDNITNDARINMGFEITPGAVITYTLKSVVKDKEKLLGKENTLFNSKLLDKDGYLLLPTANKTGQYILEMKQNGIAVDTKPFEFTIDNVVPKALKVALNKDTGKKDTITSDATLKLTGLAAGVTVQWRDSADGNEGVWQDVAANLLTVNGKTILLKAGELLDGDFKGTLEFRQVDLAGNAQKTVSKVTLTYDTTAPEVLDSSVPSEVDSIANNQTSVVRVFTNEKLAGLDAKDFVVSNSLASVKGVREVKLGDGGVAYDVTLKAAKTGGGDVSLKFATNATVTDLAGNALDTEGLAEQSLADFWIGNGSLQVSLVEDTGKVGDNITNNGDIQLAAIRPDSRIMFSIKENSVRESEGSDWLLIDDIAIEGSTAIVNIETLYALADLSIDDLPLEGWKDTIEFKQVNNVTNKASAATALTFTYDNYVDMFPGEPPESDEVGVSKSVVLQFTGDEKLVGFDKNDLTITNALASITSIKEQMVKEDDWVYWNYNVTVKAGNTTADEVAVAFAESASISDVAGNEVDLAAMEPYLLFIV